MRVYGLRRGLCWCVQCLFLRHSGGFVGVERRMLTMKRFSTLIRKYNVRFTEISLGCIPDGSVRDYARQFLLPI